MDFVAVCDNIRCMNYDIIGDIHGHSEKLRQLLLSLGYKERGGAFRHSSRKAMFVGDFVDRGPGQIATLDIVRRMIEADSAEAVLGNHEFNAIAFATPHPLKDGEYLRRHTESNFHQHHRFLEEVGLNSQTHKSWIEFFMQLPMFVEKDDFRVVHACWHQPSIDNLKGLLTEDNKLTRELMLAGSTKGTVEFESLETLCKGIEIDLPEGLSYNDENGISRTRTRVRWWDEQAETYKAAAIASKVTQEQLPEELIPDECKMTYDKIKPVFFGHYWFSGQPRILNNYSCCVDYCAAHDEKPLVAYRWEGDPELKSENLVSVGGILVPEHIRRPTSSPFKMR